MNRHRDSDHDFFSIVLQGIVELWFTDVFLRNIGSERPQVLFYDGHVTHTHVELLTLAREHDVILVEIPSHCSNWLQPLDR